MWEYVQSRAAMAIIFFLSGYAARLLYEMKMEERCPSLKNYASGGKSGFRTQCERRMNHVGPHANETKGIYWTDADELRLEREES